MNVKHIEQINDGADLILSGTVDSICDTRDDLQYIALVYRPNAVFTNKGKGYSTHRVTIYNGEVDFISGNYNLTRDEALDDMVDRAK